ncbi:hypothetical protein [Roseinatronobacter monicus]|uniref:hypothetical protein n=1 Tax=Roseinatronobacter monicus TaxID=393481 RepID=UPI003F3EB189
MQKFFLVCVNVPLVAKDISTTLEQLGLGVPLVAGSIDEAMVMLTQLPIDARVAYALVQAAPAEFAASALRTALDGLKARTILLHDDLSPADPVLDYPILTLPFFTEDLEGAIASFRAPHKSGRRCGAS